jgi:glycosyltransferase involved in cell wall biosynthesis
MSGGSESAAVFAYTVGICTLNRCELVLRAAAAVLDQLDECPGGTLLIVDNGSDDGTVDALRALAARDGRVRVDLEPVRGNYHARARVIALAAGAALIFLDDDALPRSGWLRAMVACLAENPDIGAVGGRIEPIWEAPPPPWLPPKLAAALPVLTDLDAPQECRFPSYPPGISLGIRLNGCARLYCGPERKTDYPLGRAYDRPVTEGQAPILGGEDTDLVELFARNGFKVVIRPDILVGHQVPAARLVPEWFLRKFEGEGHVRIRLLRAGGHKVWHPAARKMLLALPALALLRLTAPLLPDAKRIFVEAYYRKCRGAWREVLTGPGVRPLPYLVPSGDGGPAPQTMPR